MAAGTVFGSGRRRFMVEGIPARLGCHAAKGRMRAYFKSIGSAEAGLMPAILTPTPVDDWGGLCVVWQANWWWPAEGQAKEPHSSSNCRWQENFAPAIRRPTEVGDHQHTASDV